MSSFSVNTKSCRIRPNGSPIEFAWKLLQQYSFWWEPGLAKTILNGIERPLIPVFYRIHAVQITGHRATIEPEVPPDTRRFPIDAGEGGWLQKVLRQIRGRH